MPEATAGGAVAVLTTYHVVCTYLISRYKRAGLPPLGCPFSKTVSGLRDAVHNCVCEWGDKDSIHQSNSFNRVPLRVVIGTTGAIYECH